MCYIWFVEERMAGRVGVVFIDILQWEKGKGWQGEDGQRGRSELIRPNPASKEK